MYSFLANLTIFPVEASGGNSLDSSSFELFKFPVGTKISDAMAHPTEPVIFAVDSANSVVYSVNVETGTVEEAYVDGTIERLDYFNDELFVTVLTGPYDSYRPKDDQNGAIAVIDANTMELKEKIDIDIDPFDIVAGRDGYLYVTSGSGQWTNINSYSRSTKKLTDSKRIRQKSFAELHPTLNRIYTIDTDISPRDYTAYNIDNGKFVSSYDSPYHGDYRLAKNFKISPDGKYLFNGSGVIFTCDEDKTKDMSFAFELDKAFSDIAFNMEESKFYTTNGGNQIYVYNYEDYKNVDTLSSIGEISKLFYVNGKLCALSKNDNGMPMFEVINELKIIYGDVYQDGEVDSLDVTYLKRYILRKGVYELSEYSFLAADVDGDGRVDSLDLTLIKRYLLRKISEFPVSKK